MKSSWISLDRLPSMSRKPFVAAAARALHRIVEESVMLLNSLVLSRRKVFRAIGQKASGWPVMHSDLPDEIKRNEKIHSVLALGAKSFINATKQSPKERQRKHSQTDPATKLTMHFVANLEFLKGISKGLRADDPSQEEFRIRVRKLVKAHRSPSSVFEVIEDCAFLGNPTKDTLEQYHKLIVRVLRLETKGHPERVRELRPLGVSKASCVTSDFDKLRAEQALKSNSAIIMFLKNSKSSSAIERAIGEEIENKLRQRMESWLR
jgi:hypothetical protein